MNFYTFTITLILIMDPLGNVPLFLSTLKKFEPKDQMRIILRECAIAFVILVIFLFFGNNLMHGLHISTPALSVAGSIILFIIAIRMIFPKELIHSREEELEEPLIVPLAVPLTAGPSALAILVLYATRYPHFHLEMFYGVILATFVFTIVMLCSRYLMKILGKRGLIAIERLMGMILTIISIQMLLSGLEAYLSH